MSRNRQYPILPTFDELFKPVIKALALLGGSGSIEEIINILYNISPSAFERLAQRILRESGFFQVEVTGKTGDGGIDGKGIVRINGFLSFHVIFQCKRYKGVITPDKIRDFRGAMQGRAD